MSEQDRAPALWRPAVAGDIGRQVSLARTANAHPSAAAQALSASLGPVRRAAADRRG